MAVPTISALSQASGLASGYNRIEITGTNFRLPPDPPAVGYVGGPEQITVAVEFQGVAAPFCAAAADTLILCAVPPWTGGYATMPVALDVRVANLDDAGAEIPGESATLADAYTIHRPNLAAESFLQQHVRALIRYFRRYILRNTVVTTNTDFVGDLAANKRAQAAAPVIYLAGPRILHNGVQSPMFTPYEDHATDPEGWVRREVPIGVDLAFDVYLIACGHAAARTAQGLVEALMTTLRDVPTITVAPGYEYQVLMPFDGFPVNPTAAHMSDLHIFQAVCAIKGVHIQREVGIILERGWRVYDNDGLPTLDVQGTLS